MTAIRIRRAAILLAAAGLSLAPAGAAAADATPSPSAPVVTTAGSSFLTATALAAGQPAQVSASTGDYLYWSFTADPGQRPSVSVTVKLPERHGGGTWTVDVFDGLRRRQACTAGPQTRSVTSTDATVELGCELRTVRSWAEPWSADPLPGAYYVRVSVIRLPERDLGLPIEVGLRVSVTDDGDPQPEGGKLRTPVAPAVAAGEPGDAWDDADPDDRDVAAATGGDEDGFFDWLPAFSARWVWTTTGGVLAALAGIVGFGLTRRPRGAR